MGIKIKAHASLARKLKGKLDCKIDPEEGISVEKLLHKLDIPKKEVFLVIVNGKKSSFNTIIKEGDTLNLFPFIGGG